MNYWATEYLTKLADGELGPDGKPKHNPNLLWGLAMLGAGTGLATMYGHDTLKDLGYFGGPQVPGYWAPGNEPYHMSELGQSITRGR